MKQKKGVALILVVSILAVAGIMAVSFAFTMRLELKAAVNFLEATRASYLAEAGISYAQAVLREDSDDIDSLEDAWHTVFSGDDVDNDGDGMPDSKWIYVYDKDGKAIGRYAVLVGDEAGFLNINIATRQNLSPLKVTEGWTPHEISLRKFLGSFALENSEDIYEDIIEYRYGPDGEPGKAGIDDNSNQRVLESDGIDNNADGIIDEAGEGIDEPMEFDFFAPSADDRAFETPFELLTVESIDTDIFNMLYPYVTSYSVDKNIDMEGRLRKNLNHMNASSLAVFLQESGVRDPFQKAVNIIDACDEDFSQSMVTKLYNRLSAINRGPIGDWGWKSGHYETDVKDGEELKITWINLPEGEYYIGVFGSGGDPVNDMVGDVTINGMTQKSVKNGEILRFGTISFENRMLELSVKNSYDTRCYFSHLELYPRLGQEGFSSIEVRGVEGIRISELMVKPLILRTTFSGQEPGGDWMWQNGYYLNNEPNGGRFGKGIWVWEDVPNGYYYVRFFAGTMAGAIGDVEINGSHSYEMLDGELFNNGETVRVTNGKLTISIQNNLSSGSVSFRSVELSREPDAEYIEIVNLTPGEVSIGGWSIEGPGKEGWPASIPLGTVIGPYKHMALCADRNDSQQGIGGNHISFVSVWGMESSAELHFLRTVTPDSDLLPNDPNPEGNIITLKDTMGHIVDQVEYNTTTVVNNKSLERSDPSYVLDSNSNGIPDNWYISDHENGATPGLPNENEGMREEIGEEIIEHEITELSVKNNGFSSVAEIGIVSLGSEEWETIPIEDISKVSDRLNVLGIRLEAEGNAVEESQGGWKLVQRASPFTDHFESGDEGSEGVWLWDAEDGVRDGYYTLRIYGEEEEAIAVSIRLADASWTSFTPPLTPGPGKSILVGNVEIGTDGILSTASNTLELKIKNASETGGAHFDFVRLDPVNSVVGRVNINTASKKVLSVLPGMNDSVAESVINERPYGNKSGLRLGIGDLISSDVLGGDESEKKKRFKQISNLITVHSDIFRITVTAQTLDDDRIMSEKKIWAVFER